MNKNDEKTMDMMIDDMLAAVEALPKHHRQVLEMRNGLYDFAPSSYEEIAKKLDFPVEKIKELETEALRMMRKPSEFAAIDKTDTLLRVKLKKLCYQKLHDRYGANIHPKITDRLEHELDVITENKHSRIYLIAHEVAKECMRLNAPHIARGAAGSSFVAFLLGITEGNPLPPHTYCPKCGHTDFDNPYGYVFEEWRASTDLGLAFHSRSFEVVCCPECDCDVERDGNEIPFEVFAWRNDDKKPRFDFDVPEDLKKDIENFMCDIIENDELLRAADDEQYVETCNCITVIGNRGLSKLYMLQKLTGVDTYPVDNIKEVFDHSDFSLSDYMDIPWMPHRPPEELLKKCSFFSDLVDLLGVCHGTAETDETAGLPLYETDVYEKSGIAHRDDIMQTLMQHGFDREEAFSIMRIVMSERAWWAFTEEDLREKMLDKGISDEYISSMGKIRYLFPKAHDTEFAIKICRFIWYKLNFPEKFAEVIKENENTQK